MSRTTVRAGIGAWLTANVAGINTFYVAMPRVIPGDAFFNPATYGGTSGCVAIIDIMSDHEKRIALGGEHSGWKRVDYVVGLQLFFRQTAPAQTVGADSAIVAMQAFDTIIETLKTRIRADRTAGGAVWQWGEGDGLGSFDIEGVYGDTVERGDAIEIWAAITIKVTEMTQT